MLDILILAVAGFATGLLNAVAGGGTFISFPALIYVGVPPIAANASATLAALPGYASSAFAFRDDIKAEGTLGLPATLAITVIGAIIGALLLIVTPGAAFDVAVPVLLALATVLFAAGPRLVARLRARGGSGAGPVASAAAMLGVSIYGGYFNGGLGIMLLATFGLIGYVNLHGMNGLKNLLSALLSLISAAAFVMADLIAWGPALSLAVAITLGGYVGARASRKIKRTDRLRAFVVLVGIVMTVIFTIRVVA
ncbi:sulfite exporter TauE/SafE family protein [Maritimibacter sp. DP1N21-5]|uniref:sulfite exporter TauE/SafE family protein n=1 Tax=Maritimibacter sp. DP1N21-5 TaxID=2836867 RepID=UPI001C440ED1|nr:sulfite exporter TauE/SafE family protein [Maritimibacter sp. DP1N21-5]MBV7407679.1 sulfite exporter TauE/SafE family protein [Maritimibacter sp. DP1N21-5]